MSSALWLQLTLVACYLPNGIVEALVSNSKLSSSVLLAGRYTLVSFVKLILKPDPLLFEDRRSETSSKRNN